VRRQGWVFHLAVIGIEKTVEVGSLNIEKLESHHFACL
jgi:hypothetical protein